MRKKDSHKVDCNLSIECNKNYFVLLLLLCRGIERITLRGPVWIRLRQVLCRDQGKYNISWLLKSSIGSLCSLRSGPVEDQLVLVLCRITVRGSLWDQRIKLQKVLCSREYVLVVQIRYRIGLLSTIRSGKRSACSGLVFTLRLMNQVATGFTKRSGVKIHQLFSCWW